jgi:SpoIID/LytB domain protein
MSVQSSISRLTEPTMAVGVIDRQAKIAGCLNGLYSGDGFGSASGIFSAQAAAGNILLTDAEGREVAGGTSIRLTATKDSTFTLFDVVIGNRFHWERTEEQVFQGNLILKLREDGTIAAINEIGLEDYLRSVISSEMSAAAPIEFLKAHSILSRSWLLAALKRKKEGKGRTAGAGHMAEGEGEIVRWYEQEDHDLYDVCADDHCQRYQGVTKIFSPHVEQVVGETHGKVLAYEGEICDARYSKACGGLTEEFPTAWEDKKVPYLTSIPDSSAQYGPVSTEEQATHWVLSEPVAYCNTKDKALLERILPAFDQETGNFFRWETAYSRKELEEILREKSGFDFGTLKEIRPLQRGPSGRIYRLQIVGSKKSLIVGKELEIRRWLSETHLYSSAFVITVERDLSGEVSSFTLHGAGWGHGVGLCQIGAAVMAAQGFKAEEILRHYFPGAEIARIY